MKKKMISVMLSGVLAAGMSAGSVQAAAEDTSGDLYVFIAASLNNAMEEIQKDFNEDYPDVNILYNADSSNQTDGCTGRRRTGKERFCSGSS